MLFNLYWHQSNGKDSSCLGWRSCYVIFSGFLSYYIGAVWGSSESQAVLQWTPSDPWRIQASSWYFIEKQIKKNFKKQKESLLQCKLWFMYFSCLQWWLPQNGLFPSCRQEDFTATVKHSETWMCNVYHRLELWDGYKQYKTMFWKPSSLTCVGYTP